MLLVAGIGIAVVIAITLVIRVIADARARSDKLRCSQLPAALRTKLATADCPYDYARPSSNHVGGVNVAYCDGHIQFLSDETEYFVYCLLMSPDGKSAKPPGKTDPIKTGWFGLSVDVSRLNR
ncbi:MAG: DUF1559 domain-containing protein [Planctomycetes bacterium]|nr:DUF1559 domain-containing protein [Planctomycetota bacterium]